MVLTIGKTHILQDLMSRVTKCAGKIRQHVIITRPKYECHRRMWMEDNHVLVGMIVGSIGYYVFISGYNTPLVGSEGEVRRYMKCSSRCVCGTE